MFCTTEITIKLIIFLLFFLTINLYLHLLLMFYLTITIIKTIK